MVVMLKIAVVEPAGTVMLEGTKAAVPVVHRATERPPEGAAALSVTVPLDVWPPVTVLGLTFTLDTVAAAPARVTLNAVTLLALL